MNIYNNFTEYPPVDVYYLAIHSPNILQRYSKLDYIEVKPSVIYDNIKYSQLNIELLVNGYESNCAEYNIKNDQDKFWMESDCRVLCFAKFVKGKLSSMRAITSDLIRREFSSCFDIITKDSEKIN